MAAPLYQPRQTQEAARKAGEKLAMIKPHEQPAPTPGVFKRVGEWLKRFF